MKLTKKQVLSRKEEILKNVLKFSYYEDAEMTIYYEKGSSGYKLELGNEIFDPSSALSDAEVVQWAEENTDVQDDNKKDIAALRSSYDESMFGLSPNWTYPSGRAFDLFNEWEIDEGIWNLLNISVIEGEGPGSNWCGVEVDDFESLILIQWVLAKQGVKANFSKPGVDL